MNKLKTAVVAFASFLGVPIALAQEQNAFQSMFKIITDILSVEITIPSVVGAGGAQPLWAVAASFTVLFSVVYSVAFYKIPLFKDRKGPSIAFSIAISAMAMFTTPFITWVVGIVSLSTTIGVIGFMIAAVWIMIALSRSGIAAGSSEWAAAGKVSAQNTQVGAEAAKIRGEAEADIAMTEKEEALAKQASKFAKKELKKAGKIEDALRSIKEMLARAQAITTNPSKKKDQIDKALAEATAAKSMTQWEIGMTQNLENIRKRMLGFMNYDKAELNRIGNEMKAIRSLLDNELSQANSKNNSNLANEIRKLHGKVDLYFKGEYVNARKIFETSVFDIQRANTLIANIETVLNTVSSGVNTLRNEISTGNIPAAITQVDTVLTALNLVKTEFGQLAYIENHLAKFEDMKDKKLRQFNAEIASFKARHKALPPP